MSELHQEQEQEQHQETQQTQQEVTQQIETQVGGATKKAPVKIKNIGKKHEVYHGKAKRTSGGLRKEDLMMNRHNRIVSKKQHARGKQQAPALKKWQEHLKKFHKAHPKLSLREAMMQAKKTYKKTKKKTKKPKKKTKSKKTKKKV